MAGNAIEAVCSRKTIAVAGGQQRLLVTRVAPDGSDRVGVGVDYDEKAVLRETLCGLSIAGQERAVEEFQTMSAMLSAMAQDFDGTPLRDLPLQLRQESARPRPAPGSPQSLVEWRRKAVSWAISTQWLRS